MICVQEALDSRGRDPGVCWQLLKYRACRRTDQEEAISGFRRLQLRSYINDQGVWGALALPLQSPYKAFRMSCNELVAVESVEDLRSA